MVHITLEIVRRWGQICAPRHTLLVFFLDNNNTLFGKVTVFVKDCQYLSIGRVLTYFWKHQIEAERKTFDLFFKFRPELSWRPDWWPNRCPTFVNILQYIVHIYYIYIYIWYCTYIQYRVHIVCHPPPDKINYKNIMTKTFTTFFRAT